MDWLFSPIDATRAHEVGLAVSWHARSMVLGWAVLAPLSVLAARYFKVLPGQDWPRELDTQLWWRSHWMGQGIVVLLSLLGLGLILGSAKGGSLHGALGYVLLTVMGVQVGLGVFRGSKGGPTAPACDGSLRGDHYDMTPWRVMFEWTHKVLGYLALVLSVAVVVLGLWQANAPLWMWWAIGLWWGVLICAALVLQVQGRAIDTYQAIWGPDPVHPGNRRAPIGWGLRRLEKGQRHVRND
jgi:hypothetical protein